MSELTLFGEQPDFDPCRQGDDYASDRTQCQHPYHNASTAYQYGCRCKGCRKAHAAYNARLKTGPRTCNEPGCDNPRRQVQAARYCDEHARSKNYEPTYDVIVCVVCDTTTRALKARTYDICKTCREPARNFYIAAVKHGVPQHLVIQWANDPHCELCTKPLSLTRQWTPGATASYNIDHDHRHCPSEYGCASCVRGLLCVTCNMRLGVWEAMNTEVGVDTLIAYANQQSFFGIDPTAAPRQNGGSLPA